MSAHFVKGPAYGLSAEVKNKIAQKYDVQKELDLRDWIDEITGIQLTGPFHQSLKDGVVLCELINCLQPGSVKKIHRSQLNWHKLENLSSFIRAIQDYGLKAHDIFEANDLFESGNMTQVQSTLLSLANTAKTKGVETHCCVGVRYSDRQERKFDSDTLNAGQSVIGLQMGTNKLASQAGMTAYGTRRHLYDPRRPTAGDGGGLVGGHRYPDNDASISLQMGTNKLASQAGMTCPGTRRHVHDAKLGLERCDASVISLQMGTNRVATQRGMGAYGLGRQVCDTKYCQTAPVPARDGQGGVGVGCGGGGVSYAVSDRGGLVFNGGGGGSGRIAQADYEDFEEEGY